MYLRDRRPAGGDRPTVCSLRRDVVHRRPNGNRLSRAEDGRTTDGAMPKERHSLRRGRERGMAGRHDVRRGACSAGGCRWRFGHDCGLALRPLECRRGSSHPRLAHRSGRGGRVCRRRHDRLCGRLLLRRCSRGEERWQERQRVDVSLVIGGPTQPEVHERAGEVDDATRPDTPDDVALGDGRSAPHSDRAEVDERGRVAVRGLDRDRLAAARDDPGKRDHSLGGRVHVRAARGAEVDAAVLTGGVRVRAVERERTEDGALDRPRPRLRRRGQHERREREKSESPKHGRASLLPDLRTSQRYQDRAGVVNTGYKVRR
jgi:hypothetical protein